MSAWQLLPAVRDLFSKRPEYYYHAAWELQHVLYPLNYTDDLADELVRVKEDVHRLKERVEEDGDLRTALRGCDKALKALELQAKVEHLIQTPPSFARTLGVEKSELISRLDTFATRKRKAWLN